MWAYRIRNVFTRIVGIWWAVLSGIALFAGIVGSIRWLAGYDVPIQMALTQTAVTAVTFSVGVACLRVRPYRPDLGDRPFKGVFTQPSEPRKWWTGDPL